jgi:hypothetical protein
MKLLRYFLILSVSSIGCRNAATDVNPGSINEQLIEEIFKISNVEAQKAAYATLNSNQKDLIWKKRISTFLSLKQWDKNQIDHLNLLSRIISPQFFDGSTSDDAIKRMDDKWSPVAIELFGKEVIAPLVTSFSNLEQSSTIITNNSRSRVAASCGCNGDSIWDCKACNSADACSQGTGCGWFLSQSCNKSCYIAPVQMD